MGMTPAARTALAAFVLASAAVAPFTLLELRYGSPSYSSFPYPLFGFLWLLSAAFVVGAFPLFQAWRTGTAVARHPLALGLRIVVLALVAFLWIGVVQDQMPCFLGVPICD
jgi:hypothetical protein